MSEDYLWNKTGEPDPEIEQLERRLSSLRYQRPAQPLALPANPRRFFRRSHTTALAAAATFIILVLAGGLWFAFHQTRNAERKIVLNTQTPEVSTPAQIASGPPPPVGPVNPTTRQVAQADESPKPIHSSPSPRRIVRPAPSERRQMQAKATTSVQPDRAQQIARGEEAKAKLILALHIASDKLNAVQKKIRGPIS